MGFVLGCLWYLFTAGLTIVACGFATVFFALVLSTSFNMPMYGPYEAMGDVQWIMLVLLLHDRFVGPYSRLLARVASKLSKKESE